MGDRCFIKKIALAIAVIIFCVISIVGITVSIFTSNESDGKINVIVGAGTVDVDIVNEAGDSLEGQLLDFITTGENTEILWEPGATFYTQGFLVKNKGTSPVKYIMSISEKDDDEHKEFKKAFEFYITTDRNDITKKTDIKSWDGALAPTQESEVFYLVIHMKEEANDDFQNKTYSGIGITVSAVQANGDFQ